jgi:hypothetical protein
MSDKPAHREWTLTFATDLNGEEITPSVTEGPIISGYEAEVKVVELEALTYEQEKSTALTMLADSLANEATKATIERDKLKIEIENLKKSEYQARCEKQEALNRIEQLEHDARVSDHYLMNVEAERDQWKELAMMMRESLIDYSNDESWLDKKVGKTGERYVHNIFTMKQIAISALADFDAKVKEMK